MGQRVKGTVQLLARCIFAAIIMGVYIFMLAPIVIVVIMSFNASPYLSFPPEGFTLRWYGNFFSSPIYLEATVTSLVVSSVAVSGAMISGTMAAYALQRFRMKFSRAINAWMLFPALVPTVVLGLSLLYVLGMVGLGRSIPSVIVGHVLYVLPFVVVIVSSALQNCGRDLEEAAMSLGASRWYAFRTVTLPVVFPGIISAALFAFILSLDEFIMTLILGGGVHVITLPIRIFTSLKFAVDPTVTAVSTVFIFSTTILFLVAVSIQRRQLRRRKAPDPARSHETGASEESVEPRQIRS